MIAAGHRRTSRSLLPALALLAVLGMPSIEAHAQQPVPPARILGAAAQSADLAFPQEPSSFSFLSAPGMAIYKPEGQGPFPAIVLLHQCGGLSGRRWQNDAMLQWAKDAVAQGYVAFLVDYMGPRGIDTLCSGPRKGMNFFRGTKDAFQAGMHLQKLDFVDKSRIGVAGYSWGAMLALFASSRTFAQALAPGPVFRAAVAFYPGCFRLTPPAAEPYETVQPDIATPLLALLGEADTETPAAECVEKLGAAKAAGAPVEWHLYPGTTHCWDCRNLDGFSKIDARGNRVLYRYDAGVTADSAKRMFDFFKVHLKPAP